VAKVVEVGLESTIRFTEMDKASHEQHRIRVQIANTDFIIIAESLQKWMNWNTKFMSKVFLKNNDFTSLGLRDWLQIGCTPSCQLLGMEYAHPHQSLEAKWGALQMAPLLLHDLFVHFGLRLHLPRGHSLTLLTSPLYGEKGVRRSCKWLGFGGGDSTGGSA
jgi:hypothetical protein